MLNHICYFMTGSAVMCHIYW